MTWRRALRLLAPALLGATVVLLVRGDTVAAFVAALGFFAAYVGSAPPRARVPARDDEEAGP